MELLPERVARLADALRRLATAPAVHPALVPLVDAGIEGTSAFLVMAFQAGETLDVALRRFAPATLEQALPLLSRIAAAIDAAARVGVAHGALHPRDVFVDDSMDVRMTGFGVVQALESAGLTAPVLRKPYVASERSGGRWDSRADVYSLGVIAHELLTGRRPMGRGEQDGVFAAELQPQQRVQVRRLLGTALAEDPADRFKSATAFVAALENVTHHPAVTTRATESAAAAARLSTLERQAPRPEPAPIVVADLTPLTLADGDAPRPADVMASHTPADLPLSPYGQPDLITIQSQEVAPEGEPESQTRAPQAEPLDAHVLPSDESELSLQTFGLNGPASTAFASHAPARRRGGSSLLSTAAAVLVGLAAGIGGGYYLAVHRLPAAAVSPAAEATISPAPGETGTLPAIGETTAPLEKSDTPDTVVASDPAGAPLAASRRNDLRASSLPRPDVERAGAPSGQLVIHSTPSGAMVTIDGRLSGETPMSVRQLSMGAHTVQVARPGHIPRIERVMLVPSLPTRLLNVSLEAGLAQPTADGSVDVESRPRGARVTVDGRFVGQAPLRVVSLRSGLHVVRLELAGYRPAETQVLVDPGRSAPLRLTLQSVR